MADTDTIISVPSLDELATTLLPRSDDGGTGKRIWWQSSLAEAKIQILFALPMIVTNVSYYSITLVSVMYAGHIGQLELAGSTLANSWAVVTGLAFMVASTIHFFTFKKILLSFVKMTSAELYSA